MNPQSRKWMLTINNPYENGMSIELIRERTELCFPEYYCGCVETATTGTVHVHLFVFSKSPIRFSTLQNRFPIAHIEKANGTSKQNRDYILKSGKWAETKKAETSVEGSFFEWGVMPKERDERQPKMSLLVDEIDSGKSVAEIIRDSPEFALKTKDIEATRQTLLFEKYLMEEREVKVIYLFGETGTGKTRSIYKAHPAKDVC